MSSLLQETSQKAPSLASCFLPTFYKRRWEAKGKPSSSVCKWSHPLYRVFQPGGPSPRGEVARLGGVLLPSRTYPHMGRRDPVRLVDLAGSARQWEQSHSGKSLLFLPYYSLAGAIALARRCRILPTVLPGLLDWPCPLRSPGCQRKGVGSEFGYSNLRRLPAALAER